MDPFSDNCLYMIPFSNGDCREMGRKTYSLVKETFGPNSKCFQGNYVNTKNSSSFMEDLRGVCHEYKVGGHLKFESFFNNISTLVL